MVTTCFCMCTDEEAGNEGEDMKVQLFLQYLKAQEDEGFEGPFADWVGEELAEQLGMDDGDEEPELEEARPRMPLLHLAPSPPYAGNSHINSGGPACLKHCSHECCADSGAL